MKYIFLIALSISLGCKTPKDKVNETNQTKEETVKNNTHVELLAVVRNPDNVTNAKALIVNSGLIWEQLIVNENTLKVSLIKVPTNKKDFWVQRLDKSDTFLSVTDNKKEYLDDIKFLFENTLIKLTKSICFGTCPSYEAVILKDGSIIFTGKNHVLIKGVTKFTLSENQLSELKDICNNPTLKDIEKNYVNMRLADAQSTNIYLNNKQIKINTWQNVPTQLVKIHDYIETILKDNSLLK